eukprot:scaffold68409_cov63-Phaeocystis_antarctica.AAC.1
MQNHVSGSRRANPPVSRSVSRPVSGVCTLRACRPTLKSLRFLSVSGCTSRRAGKGVACRQGRHRRIGKAGGRRRG